MRQRTANAHAAKEPVEGAHMGGVRPMHDNLTIDVAVLEGAQTATAVVYTEISNRSCDSSIDIENEGARILCDGESTTNREWLQAAFLISAPSLSSPSCIGPALPRALPTVDVSAGLSRAICLSPRASLGDPIQGPTIDGMEQISRVAWCSGAP